MKYTKQTRENNAQSVPRYFVCEIGCPCEYSFTLSEIQLCQCIRTRSVQQWTLKGNLDEAKSIAWNLEWPFAQHRFSS